MIEENLIIRIHNQSFSNHIKNAVLIDNQGGFKVKENVRKQANSTIKTLSQAEKNADQSIKNMKEEISLELSEMGNLTPKQEPMTPNHRDKTEREKHY